MSKYFLCCVIITNSGALENDMVFQSLKCYLYHKVKIGYICDNNLK